MNKLFAQKIILVGLVTILAVLVLGAVVQAATVDTGVTYATATGLGTQDIRVTIARVIRAMLGFLGIVAVVIILYGGYLYMTAQGNVEKVATAKKLLIGAAIGLLIVLTAFAIASFVLNYLVSATGGGGDPGDGDDGDDGDGGGGSSYCPDPSGNTPDSLPWVCLDPTEGLWGTGITVTGGNVGTEEGEIYFQGDDGSRYDVTIIKCNDGDPNWFRSNYSKIVIEAPSTLTLSNNDYQLVVETADGRSSEFKDWGAKERLDYYRLLEERADDRPYLICLLDNNGNEIDQSKTDDPVTVKGKRFGDANGTVYYGCVKEDCSLAQTADFTAWQPEIVNTQVPLTVTGHVRLTTNDDKTSSNGIWLKIYCSVATASTDCLSSCCISTRCSAAVSCLPGEGQACQVCGPGGCNPDYFCNASCICQSPAVGSSCDTDPVSPACDPGNCGTSLYCSSAEQCTCQYEPQIYDILPSDGAPGNFVTIIGRGFGTTPNVVNFILNGINYPGLIPAGCGARNIWRDDQVIIEVPEAPLADNYGVELINADNLKASWDGSFAINDQVRPALCNVTTASDCTAEIPAGQVDTYHQGEFGQNVRLCGKNFGLDFFDQSANQISTAVIAGDKEFDNKTNWSWSDSLITNTVIPNIYGRADVQTKVQTEFSNPFNFKFISPEAAPVIDFISPAKGPFNQYVTIFGSNFGTQGVVKFLDDVEGADAPDTWQEANTDFAQEICAQNYWHDKYIIVKVPTGINVQSSKVVVITDKGTSNSKDFEFCTLGPSCPLLPGICYLEPDQAPAGETINIYGENFGSYQTGSAGNKIIFSSNQEVDPGLNNWSPTVVSDVQVLPDVVTGPLFLTNKDNDVSNSVLFEADDCRDYPKDGVETICDSTEICCQRDGVCKTELACYGQSAPLCTYKWSFTTGDAAVTDLAPQVVEDPYCTTKTQSPSPWKGSDSTENCVNAMISARFTLPMDSNSLNATNIVAKSCDPGNLYKEETCTSQIDARGIDFIYDNVDGQNVVTGFVFKPLSVLANNTWYQITLVDAIQSLDGISLDGDKDGFAGGAYVWYFRTRPTNDFCAIDKVLVMPPKAKIEDLEIEQNYRGFALAENCNILDGDQYPWNWYKVYSDGKRETADCANVPVGAQEPFCIATLSEDINDNYCDNGICFYTRNSCTSDAQCPNYVQAKQLATPLKQGLVDVGAEVFEDNADLNRYDEDNELEINLNIPEITRIYPDNGLIHPDVNSYVTIYGKNFGSASLGSVYFDEVKANLADCGNAWTDTIIQVKVPKAMPITTESFGVYNALTVSQNSGMVAFYNFQDTSNVKLDDVFNKYDGEIFGGQRINDQFGKGLQFTGSTYVRLNNQLVGPDSDNWDSGTIEAWLTPDSGNEDVEQVLFNVLASDNVSTFTLSFKRVNGLANLQISVNNDYSNSVQAVPLLTDRLNHFVYTYDKNTQLLNFYVNGIKFYWVRTALLSFSADNSAPAGFLGDLINKDQVLIGATRDNAGNYINNLHARLYGLAVYNKVLTETEVRQRFGLGTGQVVLLNFEQSGGVITDSSKNNWSNFSITDPSKLFNIDDGQWGKAVRLANTAINMENQAINFVDQFSVEGFFRIADLNPKIIFQTEGISLGIQDCDGTYFCLKATLSDSNDNLITRYARLGDWQSSLVLNQWNYFAGIADGNDLKVYLNGIKGTWPMPGRIYFDKNFNKASFGGANFTGSLDNLAIYNRALSEEEIASRLGAKNNSPVIVKTIGGTATSQEVFKYSQNVYPLLCQLQPNVGLKGAVITAAGDNFGDSNKTIFQDKQYGLPSFINLEMDFIKDEGIRSWANRLTSYVNPISDMGVTEIPVTVSISPQSDPFNDTIPDQIYNPGDEQFADVINPGDGYTQGDNFSSNDMPFYFSPVITSISPDNGPRGTWVTITGYNFGEQIGKVWFYNQQQGLYPQEPCDNNWSNNQIIVIVPPGAATGAVYIETAQGLTSNSVKFTVNNKPLGPGLCKIVPNAAEPATPVTVYGDRFEATKGISELIFTDKIIATIASPAAWTQTVIQSTVPIRATTGNVFVNKQLITGQRCAGFHIGSWCPSNTYENIIVDAPSNPLYFKVDLGCSASGANQILTNPAWEPGFANGLRAFDDNGVASYFDTGVLATDGAYLYSKTWFRDVAAALPYTYGGNVPGTKGYNIIYKVGTGYRGTILGKIYKSYVWRDRFWSNGTQKNLTMVSMTYHGDGNFYAGQSGWDAFYNPTIRRLKFADNVTNPYNGVKESAFWLEDVVSSKGYYDMHSEYTSWGDKALIASNGPYIFNLAPYGIWQTPDGYQVRIFKIENNQAVIYKEFTMKNNPQGIKAVGYVDGMVVSGNIIYALGWQGKISALNWVKEEWVDSWVTHKPTTYEINGTYDWQNNVFWAGQLSYNTVPGRNKIYRYLSCPITCGSGDQFCCNSDDDCNACGAGTSRCVRGYCTPYIQSFSPTEGKIGTVVRISGCYFGCQEGKVYFTGYETDADNQLIEDANGDFNKGYYKEGKLYYDNECNVGAWTCDNYAYYDQIAVEVPNIDIIPNDENKDLEHDAVDGPLKIITSYGLEDNSEDVPDTFYVSGQRLTNSDFDVNQTTPASVARVIPSVGPKGTTVEVCGSGFGETPASNYLLFGLYSSSLGTIREPWYESDLINYPHRYDLGEPFIDYDGDLEYDSSLLDNVNPDPFGIPVWKEIGTTDIMAEDYTFEIKNFIPGPKTGLNCPVDDGWSEKHICFTVPQAMKNIITGDTDLKDAGGWGSSLGMGLNYVRPVVSNIIGGAGIYRVSFGMCGNQTIDVAEQCDGSALPAIACTDLGFVNNKHCKDFPASECTSDANCSNNTCEDTCYFKCTGQCGLLVCHLDDQDNEICESLSNYYCGNNKLDGPLFDPGNGNPLYDGDECDYNASGSLLVTDPAPLTCAEGQILSCKTKNQTPPCTLWCADPSPFPPPKVQATMPYHGFTNFCTNGIIDIYFDSRLNMETIDGVDVSNNPYKNIKIQSCTEIARLNQQGIVRRTINYFSNIIVKLLGTDRQAQAQSCQDLPLDSYILQSSTSYGRSKISLLTNDLLAPKSDYRVIVVGGNNGIKSLYNGVLDNKNTPVAHATNYVFDFTTKGVANDPVSGICNVDWIDVNVFHLPYDNTAGVIDLSTRDYDTKKNDVFICAGQDNCNLELDTDQDLTTVGNQHIYEATGKYRGGISLKANYQWLINYAIPRSGSITDFNQIIEIYNNLDAYGDGFVDDDNPGATIVQNVTGQTIVTAKPLVSTAQLVISAQAQGPSTTTKQDAFWVYITLCQRPWPSVDEKFPLSSMVNVYNFDTYACLDPDLPAPTTGIGVQFTNILTNKGFESQTFDNWFNLEGNAFESQPVCDSDSPVVGSEGSWWLDSAGSYLGTRGQGCTDVYTPKGNTYKGIASSASFLIEGDTLTFKVGGSNNPWPLTKVLERANLSDNRIINVTAVVLVTKELKSGSSFVVRAQATGAGSNQMSEVSFDVGQYMGQLGIIYIYDNNEAGYVLFDDLQQFSFGSPIDIKY